MSTKTKRKAPNTSHVCKKRAFVMPTEFQLRLFLEYMKDNLDDIHEFVKDMLRPPSKRHFGPYLQRKHYLRLRRRMRATIAVASQNGEFKVDFVAE